MTLPEIITVPVTRDHIQRGRPGSPCHCAAVLAIEDELRRLGFTVTGIDSDAEVEAADNVDILGHRYEGDDVLEQLMGMFDNLDWAMHRDYPSTSSPYGPVGPCTFQLTLWVDDDPWPATEY